MAVFWPGNILKPQSISVDIAHRNLRGPSAASGFTQVVSNSAGIWKVTYSDIPVYSASMIKLWRAIDTLAEGQMNAISIPVFDHPRSPNATDELGSNIRDFYQNSVPHSDDTFFDDDTGYVSTYTPVYTTAAALSGTVSLSVVKGFPFELEPGHRFSINDRLYQIQRITSQSDTNATFTIRPPLRENVVSGDRLEFDNPRVTVRLTSDSSMFLPLNFNRHSFPPVDFIEDV